MSRATLKPRHARSASSMSRSPAWRRIYDIISLHFRTTYFLARKYSLYDGDSAQDAIHYRRRRRRCRRPRCRYAQSRPDSQAAARTLRTEPTRASGAQRRHDARHDGISGAGRRRGSQQPMADGRLRLSMTAADTPWPRMQARDRGS